MSDQEPERPMRYTRAQIAMIVFGSIMLLPGVCALVFFVGAMWEMISKNQNLGRMDAIMQMVVAVWAISLVIAAVGVALIVAARRRARAAR
jgi:uncharacterized membrane protein YdbT with pleckstrin-like domain